MALQVWLPLNGDLHNQGLKQVKIINNGTTFTNDGKLGQCCNITSGKYLGFDASNVNNNKYPYISIACWVYPTQSDSTERYVIDCYESGGCGINLKGTKLGGQIYAGGYKSCYTPNTITINTWQHICMTYNGTILCLYLNGELVNSLANSGPITYHNTCPWEIGGNPGATSFGSGNFIGKINDLRIYDHALTAKEVKEISQGLVLHYQLNNNNIGNQNLLLNSLVPTSGNGATGIVKSIENGIQKVVADTTNNNWVTFANHNTTLALNKGDTFTFSLMIKSPNSNKKPTVYFQSGMGYFAMQGTMSQNWSIIYYTGIWNIDNLTTNIHLGFSSAPGTYYIKYFKLEKGNQVTPWAPNIIETVQDNIIYDSSGYNNNGEIVGNLSLTTETPNYRIATIFSNGAYIKKTNMMFTNSSWTVSCWFKKTSNVTNAYETMLGLTKGNGSDANKKFSFYIYGTKIGCVGEKTAVSNIVTFDAALWHHACLVNNNGNFTYYMDGISIKTFSNTNCQTDCTDFVVGGRAAEEDANSIGTPWGGNLSDVRIYVTAFSADDVKKLYETSKIVNGTIISSRSLE